MADRDSNTAGTADRAPAGARELATLNLLISVTGAGLNLCTVLETALDAAAELSGLPIGVILLWDATQHSLRVAADRAGGVPGLPVGEAIPEADLARWLCGRVFVDQKPVFVANLQAEPAYSDTRAVELGAVSAAFIPLTAHDRPLGVLALADSRERDFSSPVRHILLAIGRQVAMAIEHAHLYEEATRRTEQMRVLVEVGRRLSSILDLEELLRTIVTEISTTLSCRFVALGLVDGDRLSFAAVASAGSPAMLLEGATMPSDAGLCGWVVRHRQSLCVPDITLDPRYYRPRALEGIPIRSAAIVPIQLQDQVLGVIDVESEQLDAFDSQDVMLLQAIASQAAVAISNARSYAQSEQRAAMLRALLRTTQELNSTLDLRQVLQTIAQQARALIDVDSCIITLLNPESGILTPVVALHDWADQVFGLTLKLGEGITGHVAATGVGEIVNHAERDPRALTIPDTPDVPEALLAAPLRYKDRVIGVMTLSRLGERQFSNADLDLLSNFASQAAIAVENARLYTESTSRARDLERARARLERVHDQLLQAEKLSAIGQLAAGMAHELNNPLTAIMGFAQLLESENLSPEGRSDVQRILAGVARAHRIVANLLTFARQQRLSLQTVDLAALIERILKLHGPECEAGGLTIRRELSRDLPEARVDPFQIEQLVVQLVRNAQKATREANGKTVLVRLRQSGPLVRLEVIDEGPGIPADILPRIFDPFYTTAEVGEGQGLGLSACFGIVRAHKGRIWAEPRPEGGTRFIAEFPLDAGAAPSDEATAPGAPVLVVSEEEATAEVLLAVLEEMGHRPSRVASAEAALAEIIVRHYDLVLCAANLPGMGIERLYESIRANDPGLARHFVVLGDAHPALPGVPVIPVPPDTSQVRQVVAACLADEAESTHS